MNRNKKRKIWIPIVATLGALAVAGTITAVCLTQCHSDPLPKKIEITLSTDETTLEVGDTLQLQVVTNPPVTSDLFIWSSDNEDIVKVSSTGLIKAVSVGTGNISVSVRGYEGMAHCSVTVDPISKINFNSCSWLELSAACEKLENHSWTIEQFCSKFSIDEDLSLPGIQSKDVESLNDFINQQRHVTINNKEYDVVIVGCQQDYLDKQCEQPVAFTFQFTNVIGNSEGNALKVMWEENSEKGSKDYWSSTILNALNGTNVTWQDSSINLSVLEMIGESDSDLQGCIRNIYRGSIIDDNEEKKVSYNQTKLFEPTVSNIFSQDGITSEESIITDESRQILYCNENKYQYTYYAQDDKIKDQPVSHNTGYECLIHKDLAGNAQEYWLSSPYLDSYFDDSAWYVDTMKGIIDCYQVNYYYAVLPCFCI